MRYTIRHLMPCLLFVFGALQGKAAIYYVDYNSGSDANAGTSTNQAWKHCPGDANATGTATYVLQPGDTVVFRGGVSYRGTVRINGSGTPGNPVTFLGTGWGPTNAIFSGGELVNATWTQCTNAQDCWGNANFAHIWCAPIPGWITNLFTLLYFNQNILPLAQLPTPQDPINWGHWQSEWIPIPLSRITTNSIVDNNVFNQADPNYWNGSWLATWEAGDLPDIIPITNYVASSNMVQFAMHGPLPVSGNSYYIVMNHPSLISAPGQEALRFDQNRMYLWMPDSSNPNGKPVEASARTLGFWNTDNRSNVVMDGFKFVGVATALQSQCFGTGGVTNIWLLNSEITCSRAMLPHAHAVFFQYGGGYMVSNCVVHDTQTCGICCAGMNVKVVNSMVAHVCSYNFSGIYFLAVTNGLVSNNIVHAIYGVHDNGVTAYLNSANITFINNWIYDCPSVTCMSLQTTSNINVLNNIMDGGGVNTQILSDFNGLRGNFNILNNTFVRSANNFALFLNSTNAVITVANNIIAGSSTLSNIVRYNNLYCGLVFNQDPRYGWSLGPGEIISTNLTAVFANPAAMDWRLATNSPAFGVGTNFGGAFSNLLSDRHGRLRPMAGQWPAGAYASTPALLPPGNLRRVNP